MKKTKFIFTVFFMLLTGLITGSISTYIIIRPDPEKFNFHKFHAAKVKRMLDQLDLTGKQKKQFYDIHLRYLEKVCSIFHKDKASLLQLMEEENKELSAILTPEQQKKFMEIRSKQINKFKTKFANIKMFKEEFPKDSK